MVELYEPLAEEAAFPLSVEAPDFAAHGNRKLAGQALANLVDDALKYAKRRSNKHLKPSQPRLRSRRAPMATDTPSITNHGQGTPEGDARHRVKRFVSSKAAPDRASA